MKVIGQLAILAAISLTAAGIHYRVVGPPERTVSCDPATLKPHEICLSEVMGRWQGKVLWVDARPRKEWETDGMPGSILWNVDPAENGLKMEEEGMQHLIDAPVAVIVYCSEGSCGLSLQVVEKILKLEVVTEVHALHGGIGALRSAGMLKGSN